ncbi:putative quinol monooxygenase [Thermogemmatispora sp.]|jgi:quinol monooxygenase YgiN|uniref:putative quinol monooxygenase n=1 Tax=Thermogemmatispora sp. TaxID=1968838 RepID=UPI0035E42A58
MYGTIARFRIKPGKESQLRKIIEDQAYAEGKIPGFVATYAYRLDSDPQEIYIAVLFTTKEAYWANARDPEQDARYRQLLPLFEQEPEWHDGEVIFVQQV